MLMLYCHNIILYINDSVAPPEDIKSHMQNNIIYIYGVNTVYFS